MLKCQGITDSAEINAAVIHFLLSRWKTIGKDVATIRINASIMKGTLNVDSIEDVLEKNSSQEIYARVDEIVDKWYMPKIE